MGSSRIQTLFTREAAERVAARSGGTITEHPMRMRDMSHTPTWRVTSTTPPATPETCTPDKRGTPYQRTITLTDGRTIPSHGYCAPNRCYCHHCPGAIRSRGYTTADLWATARQNNHELSQQGIRPIDPDASQRRRAYRAWLTGEPLIIPEDEK